MKYYTNTSDIGYLLAFFLRKKSTDINIKKSFINYYFFQSTSINDFDFTIYNEISSMIFGFKQLINFIDKNIELRKYIIPLFKSMNQFNAIEIFNLNEKTIKK